MRGAAHALAATAIVCLTSTPGAAGPSDDLDAIAQTFDESALRVRDADPAPLVKWSGQIRYAIRNNGAPVALEPQTRRAIAQTASLARIAAVETFLTDPQANFLVNLDDSQAPAGSRPCRTEMQSVNGRLFSVDVFVNVRRLRGAGYCVMHEVMHALAFARTRKMPTAHWLTGFCDSNIRTRTGCSSARSTTPG